MYTQCSNKIKKVYYQSFYLSLENEKSAIKYAMHIQEIYHIVFLLSFSLDHMCPMHAYFLFRYMGPQKTRTMSFP